MGSLNLDRLAIVSVPMSLQQPDEAHRRAAVDDILRRLRQDISVGAAAAMAGLPDLDPRNGVDVASPDEPVPDATSPARHAAALVTGTPSLLETIGVSLEHGRSFTDADAARAPLVAILNDHLARTVFGTTGGAVGRRVRLTSRGVWSVGTEITFDPGASDGVFTVVGVAADTTSSRSGDIQDIAYVPLAQQFEPDITFVARAPASTNTPTDGLAAVMKTTVRTVDDRLAASFAGRADVRAGAAAVVLRMVALVTGALALLALVLAMSGLYGVLSHLVVTRRREMAIRLAIGVEPGALVRLIMLEGARPVAIGAAVGLALAPLARLSAQPFLTKSVSALDPIAIPLACIPLFAAGALACYLPARRAARTDPNAALKE